MSGSEPVELPLEEGLLGGGGIVDGEDAPSRRENRCGTTDDLYDDSDPDDSATQPDDDGVVDAEYRRELCDDDGEDTTEHNEPRHCCGQEHLDAFEEVVHSGERYPLRRRHIPTMRRTMSWPPEGRGLELARSA
mgnify:CR=1 FL=1